MDCILFSLHSTLLCISTLFTYVIFGPSGFICHFFFILIVWFKSHHITGFLTFVNHHFHLCNYKTNIIYIVEYKDVPLKQLTCKMDLLERGVWCMC